MKLSAPPTLPSAPSVNTAKSLSIERRPGQSCGSCRAPRAPRRRQRRQATTAAGTAPTRIDSRRRELPPTTNATARLTISHRLPEVIYTATEAPFSLGVRWSFYRLRTSWYRLRNASAAAQVVITPAHNKHTLYGRRGAVTVVYSLADRCALAKW